MKKRKKCQCLVRKKGVSVSATFSHKSDAREWGQKKEVEVENGEKGPSAVNLQKA